MTPEQQQVIDMREIGMSRSEIARKIGKSETAVKSLIRRARKWLDADKAAQVAATAAGSNAIPHSFWVKTGTHSVYYKTPQDAHDDLLERISEAFKDITPYQPQPHPMAHDGSLTVYPLYDMHIGMLAWARETRGHDYDLDLAASDLMQAVSDICDAAPKSSKALVILGGDTLHVNDHFNETPASGHHMDADGRFEKIVDVAISCISSAIEYLAQNHDHVDVIVLRGNHDETSHIVLKAALKQRYRLADNIAFPVMSGWDKSEIYWMRHGNSLIAAHHGDKAPPHRLTMLVAAQCPDWSLVRHRVILTGHKHTMQVQDFPGVTHYSLRAFCPPDAYGAMFGGIRGISAMTFHEKRGLVNVAFDPIERE